MLSRADRHKVHPALGSWQGRIQEFQLVGLTSFIKKYL